MNDLSNATLREHNSHSCKPIPRLAVCILLLVFFVGLSVSVFILVVVHNVFFFLSFILLFALVLSFLAWNKLNWRRKAAVFWCLRSFPDSDLAAATEGQLVKITGVLPNFWSLLSSFHEPVFGGFLLFRYLMLLLRGKNKKKKGKCLLKMGGFLEQTDIGLLAYFFFIFFYLGNRFFVFNLNGSIEGFQSVALFNMNINTLWGFWKIGFGWVAIEGKAWGMWSGDYQIEVNRSNGNQRICYLFWERGWFSYF